MSKSVVPVTPQRAVARQETNPFAFLQQEIDRLFEGFGRNFPAFVTGSTGSTALPRMDVSETDKAIEVTAELPGLEAKDVQLNLADNILTIRGEKKAEKEEKNKAYRLVERSYGSFERSLALPPGINADAITASMSKGVLKIALPKPAATQSQKVKINGET